MPGTKEGAKKVVAKMLEKNPNHYKEIASKAGRSRKNPYSYFAELKKLDPKKLREINARGGRVRKKKKPVT